MLEVKEMWVVEWFPPEGDQLFTFKAGPAERNARRFAAKESVAPWNPVLVKRVETTVIEETVVPL